MEEFIYRFTRIPSKFVDDFYKIAKIGYDRNVKVIDLKLVARWLNIRIDNLKRLLTDKFEENFDYSIEKIKIDKRGKYGTHYKEKILLTPDCFKQLCMLSQTKKAKEVRKYYLELEWIIIKYHQEIKEKLEKEIGILKKNQKPKCDIKGGVIYIIEAEVSMSLYKIGKTNDLKKRLKTYNTGKGNEIEPLFFIKVNDIDKVENCIKNAVKTHQYRKYKEVYEIDIEVLKEVAIRCDDFIEGLKDHMETKEKEKNFKKSMKRIRENKKKYYIKISKNEC